MSIAGSEDEDLIQSLWKRDECLDLDSVQFGNGNVMLLDIPSRIPTATDGIQIRQRQWVDMRDAVKLPGVTLNVGLSASGGSPIIIAEKGLCVTCGECAVYGTFGFVAVSRCSDNHLEWLAFFLLSNPFVAIAVNDETIVATTNLGAKYAFPIREPEKVQVVS
ncbi:hypothetical protein [Schlesneria paludicola]|uniref:hypothetical protein n=1 Tax=Schlesneria paludicola TaxID=360056 RepID=UPI000299D1FF|nr:hypothetical protein [Schlesneria paludicola]